MNDQTTTTVAETTTEAAPLLPRLIGLLGLYATYVAAAVLTLVIAGDVAVLIRNEALVGWLALLVGTGPLVATLLTTLASYINYYGVWRVLRGKDTYDVGQDLKSHAADVPQAVQDALSGRAGCAPAASVGLLVVSLVAAAATIVPPQTPVIGPLGTWSGHVGYLSLGPGGSGAPTTATATPTLTPTATATPVVVAFTIAPTTAQWVCASQTKYIPGAVSVTLDNSGSTVDIHWQARAVERAGDFLWAAITPSSGVVAAHSTQSITITPDPRQTSGVCRLSSAKGTPWHVTIAAEGAGTYTFTDTIFFATIA